MNHQEKFQANGGGGSQCDRILAVLAGRAGKWVAMPRLVKASGSYVIHSRIADLNRRRRASELPPIENRTRRFGGACLSFYRLPAISQEPTENTEKENSVPSVFSCSNSSSSVAPPPTPAVTPAQRPEVASSNSPSPGGPAARGLLPADKTDQPAGELFSESALAVLSAGHSARRAVEAFR